MNKKSVGDLKFCTVSQNFESCPTMEFQSKFFQSCIKIEIFETVLRSENFACHFDNNTEDILDSRLLENLLDRKRSFENLLRDIKDDFNNWRKENCEVSETFRKVSCGGNCVYQKHKTDSSIFLKTHFANSNFDSEFRDTGKITTPLQLMNPIKWL
jgi:hypothetical protein